MSRLSVAATLLMAGALGCGVSAQAAAQPAAVDTKRLQAAAQEPANWMTHGGTYQEQRISRLDQIDQDNVGELSQLNQILEEVL